MATANTTGVRSRADHPAHIAPSFPLSAADRSAQRAATHFRDSDPSMDEALRRVQTDLAYDLRDRQLAETVAAEIAGVA